GIVAKVTKLHKTATKAGFIVSFYNRGPVEIIVSGKDAILSDILDNKLFIKNLTYVDEGYIGLLDNKILYLDIDYNITSHDLEVSTGSIVTGGGFVIEPLGRVFLASKAKAEQV